MKPILIIGGLNMDILGSPHHAGQLHDSLPGQVTLGPGGVGRNIAARLHALGAQVELMTVLGTDAFSHQLEAHCQSAGIGLQYALRREGPACLYMAIHNEQGDMLAAINQMEAIEALDADAVHQLPKDAFSAVVLDANICASTLEAAARHFAQLPLVADPVSCEKAERLRGTFPYLRAFKPNLREAQHLTGEDSPEAAAEALRQLGIQSVYISLGAKGVYFAGADDRGYLSPASVSTVPATGAGDAMAAGLAIGVAKGLSPRQIAQAGLDSAEQLLLTKVDMEETK